MRTKIGIVTLLIAGLMLLTAGLVSAQESNSVTGTVTDATTDLPIEDASVQVDGTDPINSNLTDALGEYALEGVSGGNQTFIVSADGYVGQTIIAEVSEIEGRNLRTLHRSARLLGLSSILFSRPKMQKMLRSIARN